MFPYPALMGDYEVPCDPEGRFFFQAENGVDYYLQAVVPAGFSPGKPIKVPASNTVQNFELVVAEGGILAGAICQFLPGTPWLNFISELLGAVVMGLMIHAVIKIGKINLTPAVATFVSTLVSGSAFVSCLFLFLGAEKSALVGYIPIVLGTAIINTILVQLLYIPLKLALKQE